MLKKREAAARNIFTPHLGGAGNLLEGNNAGLSVF